MSEHTFHIPVMGLGFTIDTPIKVARFGISSVVSIMHDSLLEQMRKFYCRQAGEEYIAIPNDVKLRAKRITAYLDLMNRIIIGQVEKMKTEPFEEGQDIVKYFCLLPDKSPTKELYLKMLNMGTLEKNKVQIELRKKIIAGSIDVNIMTKVDNINYSKDGMPLPIEYSDAISALRGFSDSLLNSSIIFSAGLNPRLFSFLEYIPDFYPDSQGNIKKRIILKVSDYRSALIQGKYLAKKGLWIYEFRIESGLNCGGHAFPTEGYLLGPILQEFKHKKQELNEELLQLCNLALQRKNRPTIKETSEIRITAQGGIGTANEDKFLREYYQLDGTGWGSPFLLVPEATNVDTATLMSLITAKKEDYYLSSSSPLGVPFNNFIKSTSEDQRKERIQKNRPGSPCYMKYLTFNTEFTERPICTASREYQDKKIKAIQASNQKENEKVKLLEEVTSKDCLCEGLSVTALLNNNIPVPHRLNAVTICPGPNLAYFSKILSITEIIGHIYGRLNALNDLYRPHIFVNELKMYIDYLKKDILKNLTTLNEKKKNYFYNFKSNLLEGIDYYLRLVSSITESDEFKKIMTEELKILKAELIFSTKEFE